jgi:hypothetical protein
MDTNEFPLTFKVSDTCSFIILKHMVAFYTYQKDGIWNSMFGFVVSTMLQLISTIKIYK